MSYNIKLPVFEGPMDLLLHLINKHKIDIYDIPISNLVEEYLRYLQTMQRLDMEITSEFLVMAANLLAIKARMLLPKQKQQPEEEDENESADPRQELVENILQYQKYQLLAEMFQSRQLNDWRCFEGGIATSGHDEYFKEWLTGNIENDDNEHWPIIKKTSYKLLLKAFNDVIRRKSKDDASEVRDHFNNIKHEEYKVSDKIWEIKKLLFLKSGHLSFALLINNCSDRNEIIVTFLALLEMIKDGEVIVTQEKAFDQLLITADGNCHVE